MGEVRFIYDCCICEQAIRAKKAVKNTSMHAIWCKMRLNFEGGGGIKRSFGFSNFLQEINFGHFNRT